MSNRADRGEDGETGLMREANKLSLDTYIVQMQYVARNKVLLCCVCVLGGGRGVMHKQEGLKVASFSLILLPPSLYKVAQ